MTSQRRQGGFSIQTAGGTIPPRRLGLRARLARAWAVLTREPKPSPFSRPRIEGDTIHIPPCPAYPFGKVMPRPASGPDPTPRTGSPQADKLTEAMRRTFGGQ